VTRIGHRHRYIYWGTDVGGRASAREPEEQLCAAVQRLCAAVQQLNQSQYNNNNNNNNHNNNTTTNNNNHDQTSNLK
jgi:uncharacterized protein YoxC